MVEDVLACIAVAKYQKYAKSPLELKLAFQNAVWAINKLMMVSTDLENFVRMEVNILKITEAPPSLSSLYESFTGLKMPKTYVEALDAFQGSCVHKVEMLARYDYAKGTYEIEAQSRPLLVEQLETRRKHEAVPIEIDLAFAECARYLDAIFVGGMGCERILSPRPLRSRPSAHDIVVNVSKTRTQLTDRLKDSFRYATKEVLITGWLGRFIIPDLKSCVERGVGLKIVTHKPQEAEGTKAATDKAEAFKELRQFLRADNVRLLPSCHARIVLIDERIAFVGSMDLDSEALAERDEAAITTDDNEVVGKTRKFFEDLFSKGMKPTW